MLEGPDGTIEWVHWHPKGDIILAGSDDFTAWLWNAQTGTCMQVGSDPFLPYTPFAIFYRGPHGNCRMQAAQLAWWAH